MPLPRPTCLSGSGRSSPTISARPRPRMDTVSGRRSRSPSGFGPAGTTSARNPSPSWRTRHDTAPTSPCRRLTMPYGRCTSRPTGPPARSDGCSSTQFAEAGPPSCPGSWWHRSWMTSATTTRRFTPATHLNCNHGATHEARRSHQYSGPVRRPAGGTGRRDHIVHHRVAGGRRHHSDGMLLQRREFGQLLGPAVQLRLPWLVKLQPRHEFLPPRHLWWLYPRSAQHRFARDPRADDGRFCARSLPPPVGPCLRILLHRARRRHRVHIPAAQLLAKGNQPPLRDLGVLCTAERSVLLPELP